MTVWLALAGIAQAQSSQNTQTLPQVTSLSQQAPVGSSQIAPSDMGASSIGTRNDRISSGGLALGARQKTAPTGGATPSVASPIGIPRLCFQPRIGWIMIPDSSFVQYNSAAGASSAGAGAVAASKPSGHLKVSRRVYSDAKLKETTECQSTLTSLMSSGVRLEDSDIDLPTRSISPDALKVNGATDGWNRWAYYPNKKSIGLDASLSKASSQSLTTDGMFPGYNNGAPVSDVQVTALSNRAYQSPIEFRRLSRNIPNLALRIKLRQVQSEMNKRRAETYQTAQDRNNFKGHSAKMRMGVAPLSFKKSTCLRMMQGSSSKQACSKFDR
jgi:hypothetical protein